MKADGHAFSILFEPAKFSLLADFHVGTGQAISEHLTTWQVEIRCMPKFKELVEGSKMYGGPISIPAVAANRFCSTRSHLI